MDKLGNNEPTLKNQPKGGYVNPEQYAAFQENMEKKALINSTIDPRSQDMLRDLGIDINIENGKVTLERGMVAHFSSLKLNGKYISPGLSIPFEKGDKLSLESFNTIQGNGSSTEVAVFTAKDKNGAPIAGKIQAELFKRNDGTVPKSFQLQK